jgi:hypothetical protein
VGHKFSLVLNREVTDEEAGILRAGGCAAAIFTTDKLLTDADVTVTRMDFDDVGSMSLVDAIEAALETVKEVPDLYVPGLSGPVEPAKPEDAAASEPDGFEPEGGEPAEAIEPADDLEVAGAES